MAAGSMGSGVVAGSTFATLQSAAMGGYGVAAVSGAIQGAGAAVAGVSGGMAAWLQKKEGHERGGGGGGRSHCRFGRRSRENEVMKMELQRFDKPQGQEYSGLDGNNIRAMSTFLCRLHIYKVILTVLATLGTPVLLTANR